MAFSADREHARRMEQPKKIEALFSHVEDASDDAPAENKKPAVYTTLFSGETPSGQIA